MGIVAAGPINVDKGDQECIGDVNAIVIVATEVLAKETIVIVGAGVVVVGDMTDPTLCHPVELTMSMIMCCCC